ncbi:hypothetical protein HMPREF0063_12530 [Aeromicrobium marinum DSM 15272]|uniref:Uncharacterized protein n=1 Tax=Aeromicrobium marinum DSM 15272 TaxID=585531 RepID=E2SES1_9ACTN|nr:hypothetical protein HMPREF0063_12530 [Aeromicrobium marinum DSM 15272]
MSPGTIAVPKDELCEDCERSEGTHPGLPARGFASDFVLTVAALLGEQNRVAHD